MIRALTIAIIVIAVIVMMTAGHVYAKKHHNLLPKGSTSSDGSDISGYPKLPKGQHYGVCEQDSKGLACDIDNNDGTPNP